MLLCYACDYFVHAAYDGTSLHTMSICLVVGNVCVYMCMCGTRTYCNAIAVYSTVCTALCMYICYIIIIYLFTSSIKLVDYYHACTRTQHAY